MKSNLKNVIMERKDLSEIVSHFKTEENLYYYSYGSLKPLLEKGGANISRYCDYTRGFFYMPINGGIINSVGDSAYKIIRYVKKHGIDLTHNTTLDDEGNEYLLEELKK